MPDPRIPDLNPVYISSIGVFLPGEPVDNDRIEEVLGKIGDTPSRSKELILRNNGINTRYYAIDPATGQMTHSNASMTAEAVKLLCEQADFDLAELECMACGTSSPDQLQPNHGAMVHGLLDAPPCEVVTTTGVCCSGMSAFNYGAMAVAGGFRRHAITTASEISSIALRAASHVSNDPNQAGNLRNDPALGFEAEFLRWMLSDAATASLLTSQKPDRRCYRLEWVEFVSMAHKAGPCMYLGGEKLADGTFVGWQNAGTAHAAADRGYFRLKQDVRLLTQMIGVLGLESLAEVQRRRTVGETPYDWFLPHYSSHYFRRGAIDMLARSGVDLPEDRWFTNLSEKGNTGSASIFVILEELLSSGRAQPGEKILCFVPESARFTYAWMELTVV